jgi:hypothetical protein
MRLRRRSDLLEHALLVLCLLGVATFTWLLAVEDDPIQTWTRSPAGTGSDQNPP